MSGVATQILSGGTYVNVDSWALTHSFPDPGDATAKALWLASITHTGQVGGSYTLPRVTFAGTQMPNRVDAIGDGAPAMNKWRVAGINTESGARINVVYTPPECTPTSKPAPSQDTMRCFPVYWAAEGQAQPSLNYFHKYLVSSVIQDDLTTDAPDVATYYSYVGAPAWHYDDNQLTDKYRTYGDWRGYGQVQTRTGPPGSQTLDTSLFMRGMDGDTLPGGARRSASVVDSEGVALTDSSRLNGYLREQIQYNGSGGAEVKGTIHDPWLSAATATNGTVQAFLLGTAKSRTRIALAAGGYRRTEVDTTFDGYGMPSTVSDLGDTAVASDDLCTRTSYVRNTLTGITATVGRAETVSVSCAATPSRPTDVVADVRTFYDGSTTWGTAPSRGNPTKTDAMAAWVTAPVYVQRSAADYDANGRVVATYNGAGTKTSTVAFTPATGGPVTATTTTNALGHTATSTVNPAWGAATATVDANSHRSDLTYDPLGRLVGVWLPGQSKAAGAAANMLFGYTVSASAPSVVWSKQLRNNGSYTTSYGIFDGLLRQRQAQTPAAGGTGRLISDTVYDGRGNTAQRNGPFFDGAVAASGVLAAVNVQQLPAQQIATFDGANRPVVAAFVVHGVEKWRTTTAYGGDRVSVTPPAGATASTTLTDGRGRTVGLRQYHGATPAGAFDETVYGYTPAGELASMRDPAGNTWRSGYDLLGRKVSSTDPDRGGSSSTYDAADRVSTTTDGRGQVLAFDYDLLDRRTAEHVGSAAGPTAASWVYDTVAKGQLSSATRIVAGSSYVQAVSGYDPAYRPTGMSTTIPAVEGALAGTYSTVMAYNVDGGVKTESLPHVPGLVDETLTFGYDGLGMPTTLGGYGSYVSATTYSPYGEPVSQQLGNTFGHQIYLSSGFEEGTRRLASVQVDRAGVPTHDSLTSYSYDPAGNVTSAVDVSAGLPADTQCFGYDYLARLVQAWTPAAAGCAATPSVAGLGGPAPYWQSYSYDLTGNRTASTAHAGGGDTVATATFPAAGAAHPHFLTSVNSTGPAGPASSTFTPDPAGNTAARTMAGAGQTLTWDPEGHLASASTPAGTTSFVYDAAGARLIRREPGATTLYVAGTEIRLDTASNTLAGTRYYQFNGTTVAVACSSRYPVHDARRVRTTAQPGTRTFGRVQPVRRDSRRLPLPRRRPPPRPACASIPNPTGRSGAISRA